MEVSTSINTSQSLALAAYSAQQQQDIFRSRDRESEREAAAADPVQAVTPRRGENVSFSNEALRLSAQTSQSGTPGAVTRTNESETANPQRQQQQQLQANAPEVQRAESAKSIAQAINAYRSTSII